jgi:uncharacterized membrane protein YccC
MYRYLVWAGYALFRTNYGLFTICITNYVVFLVVLAGGAEPATAKYRIINTLLGGTLALIFAAAWPASAERQTNRANDQGPA